MPGKQLAGRMAWRPPRIDAQHGEAQDIDPGRACPPRALPSGASVITVLLACCEAWAPIFEQLSGLLDAAEQARAGRLRQASERRWRTIAYALHRIALGRMLGCDPRRVPLRRDAKGCPRLDGVRLFTSLSHAGDAVAIAIARGGPVGVDIEPRFRAGGMADLAGRIVHADDLGAQHGLQGRGREQALLELWVRKEAVLKAAGVGLEIEMDAFCAPDRAVVRPPGADAYRVRMLDAGPDWVLAVAGTPTHCVDFQMWRPAPRTDAGDDVHRDDGNCAIPAGHDEAPPCARPAGTVSLGAV